MNKISKNRAKPKTKRPSRILTEMRATLLGLYRAGVIGKQPLRKLDRLA